VGFSVCFPCPDIVLLNLLHDWWSKSWNNLPFVAKIWKVSGEDLGYGGRLETVGSGPADPQPKPAEEQSAGAMVSRLGANWNQVYAG
jgi:hypothetical protein